MCTTTNHGPLLWQERSDATTVAEDCIFVFIITFTCHEPNHKGRFLFASAERAKENDKTLRFSG